MDIGSMCCCDGGPWWELYQHNAGLTGVSLVAIPTVRLSSSASGDSRDGTPAWEADVADTIAAIRAANSNAAAENYGHWPCGDGTSWCIVGCGGIRYALKVTQDGAVDWYSGAINVVLPPLATEITKVSDEVPTLGSHPWNDTQLCDFVSGSLRQMSESGVVTIAPSDDRVTTGGYPSTTSYTVVDRTAPGAHPKVAGRSVSRTSNLFNFDWHGGSSTTEQEEQLTSGTVRYQSGTRFSVSNLTTDTIFDTITGPRAVVRDILPYAVAFGDSRQRESVAFGPTGGVLHYQRQGDRELAVWQHGGVAIYSGTYPNHTLTEIASFAACYDEVIENAGECQRVGIYLGQTFIWDEVDDGFVGPANSPAISRPFYGAEYLTSKLGPPIYAHAPWPMITHATVVPGNGTAAYAVLVVAQRDDLTVSGALMLFSEAGGLLHTIESRGAADAGSSEGFTVSDFELYLPSDRRIYCKMPVTIDGVDAAAFAVSVEPPYNVYEADNLTPQNWPVWNSSDPHPVQVPHAEGVVIGR